MACCSHREEWISQTGADHRIRELSQKQDLVSAPEAYQGSQAWLVVAKLKRSMRKLDTNTAFGHGHIPFSGQENLCPPLNHPLWGSWEMDSESSRCVMERRTRSHSQCLHPGSTGWWSLYTSWLQADLSLPLTQSIKLITMWWAKAFFHGPRW